MDSMSKRWWLVEQIYCHHVTETNTLLHSQSVHPCRGALNFDIFHNSANYLIATVD